ncbi:MAG: ABC-type transport auxiliary lipoprotein family protein [Xanthomonadales bacterium]|nr:ABC-type transport auxiliary lipoprotein family protein [Xanthomonadales bacterium]
MKPLAIVFTLGAALSLSACSSILPRGDAYSIYQLPATTAATATAPAVDWQLRVDAPQAATLLSGTRIVVQPKPGLVSLYHGARWAQRAPQLLRDRLINAFHANGRIHGISSDDDALQSDYELDSTLQAFQSEYQGGAAPVIVLQLDARLLHAGGNRILAAHRFNVSEASAGTDISQVVAAFGRAGDKLSAVVVDWTLKQGQLLSKATATDGP